MSDQTLWELAQEIGRRYDAGLVIDANGHRRPGGVGTAFAIAQQMVEQWAREKAKEADTVDLYPFKNQTAREISKDFSIAIKEILGVPEEQ